MAKFLIGKLAKQRFWNIDIKRNVDAFLPEYLAVEKLPVLVHGLRMIGAGDDNGIVFQAQAVQFCDYGPDGIIVIANGIIIFIDELIHLGRIKFIICRQPAGLLRR